MDLSRLTTRQLVQYAKRQALECFVGIVIHTVDGVSNDGKNVTSEHVRRFNRKALLKSPRKKRGNNAGDLSIIRTGRPGSRKRLEAYAAFYQMNNCISNKYEGDTSPFMGEIE